MPQPPAALRGAEGRTDLVTVALTEEEWIAACLIGCKRQLASEQRLGAGARPRTATFEEQLEKGLDWHARGALGELVVAHWLGVPWEPAAQHAPADIGPLHVRSRPLPNGSLLIKSNDVDDDVFVLVTGVGLSYCVRGWARAKAAKRDEWKYYGPGKTKDTGQWRSCWYMPQEHLFTNLDELRKRTLLKLGRNAT